MRKADIAIRFQKARQGKGNLQTEEEKAIAEAQRILMTGLNKRGKEYLGSIGKDS